MSRNNEIFGEQWPMAALRKTKSCFLTGSILIGFALLPVGASGVESSWQTVDIAKSRMAEALVALNRKSKECSSQRVVLPANALANVDASPEEIKTALVYFHARSENSCTSLEANQFVAAANLLQRTLPLEHKTIEDLRHSDLVVESLLDELKREEHYLKLPRPLRNSLEKIPELNQPFHLLESARNIGLYAPR